METEAKLCPACGAEQVVESRDVLIEGGLEAVRASWCVSCGEGFLDPVEFERLRQITDQIAIRVRAADPRP